MKKSLLICGLALVLSIVSHADLTADVASNYGGSWTSGSNGGTGFLPWAISDNNGGGNFAGFFIGDSNAGAGDINTGGVSFGLYANPASAFVNATRAFASSPSPLDVFSFQMALNFDNGNKGFDFFAGGDGTVLNFNVGSGAGVSSSKSLTPGISVVYDYGGDDAIFDVIIAMTSASSFSYDISRTSSQGHQGTLFSGTVSGLTQTPTGFGFYVSGTDAGGAPQNTLYVNNLSVVPEPATGLLVGIGLAGMALVRRHMRLSNDNA